MEQDVNILDDGGNTALHVSIASQALLENPTFDVCEQLLAAGADPQTKNNDGDLPIFLALRLLNLKLFSRLLPILLRNGADINARGPLSLSALHFAALYGDADLVQKLIEHGALPNLSGNIDHGTPLHCCAEFSPATVGDEPRTRGIIFRPKALSIAEKKEAAARYLIDAGADVFAKFSSSDGLILEATPLDIALKVGVATVATILAEEHRTRLGDRLGALHFEMLQRVFDYAVRHQHIQIIYQFLLSKIPVDKSSLCDFGHAIKIRAYAVYYSKDEIPQCYKETQSKMVFLDRLPQHTSHLKHITNLPSLWAIIGTSSSRVLGAKLYLRIHSGGAEEIITIGLNLERIVSSEHLPLYWGDDPCLIELSWQYRSNGYIWKDGTALVERGYLIINMEWLPEFVIPVLFPISIPE
ncbi:MAG: hypothetical protein Q9187_007692 [Circinaria calcarea]